MQLLVQFTIISIVDPLLEDPFLEGHIVMISIANYANNNQNSYTNIGLAYKNGGYTRGRIDS